MTFGAAAWALLFALRRLRLLAMHFGDLALDAPAFWRITLDLCVAAITQVARNEKVGRLIIFWAGVINLVSCEKALQPAKLLNLFSNPFELVSQ